MSTRTLWSIVAVIVVVILAWFAFTRTPSDSAAPAVSAAATGFGASLEKVPLLATTTEVVQAMEQNYAPYVAPGLLAAWEANPGTAPGRLTSSPWPDRLEVTSVQEASPATYTVAGNVIEATSAGDAGTYPVTLTLENENGTWRITQFSGYPPVSVPSAGPLTVEGATVCLPHKDTSGPQTMECAIGMKDDSGRYFALSGGSAGTLPSGTRIRVEGTFTPRTDTKYQDVGILAVSTITKL